MSGNRIRELRQSAQMKQADLARRCGVKQGAISTWENGIANPKPEALRIMSEVFGAPIAYIMGYDDRAGALSDLDSALSSELGALSDDDKRDVLAYIRFRRSQRIRV